MNPTQLMIVRHHVETFLYGVQVREQSRATQRHALFWIWRVYAAAARTRRLQRRHEEPNHQAAPAETTLPWPAAIASQKAESLADTDEWHSMSDSV